MISLLYNIKCNIGNATSNPQMVGNATSNPQMPTSGCPQGTVLGPAMYLIASAAPVNGLSESSHLIQYCDDMIYIHPVHSEKDELEVQEDCNKISTHLSQQKLKINASKTKLLLCTLSREEPRDFRSPIQINGQPIQAVKELKYLGLIIDQRISFTSHIRNKVTNGRRMVGALAPILVKWKLRNSLKWLYETMIKPAMCYGATVCVGVQKGGTEIMERLQRHVARLIINNYSMPYSELLAKLGWSSIAEQAVADRIWTVYDYAKGTRRRPHDWLQRETNRRSGRIGNDWTLRVKGSERWATTRGQRSCLLRAVTAWNSLPNDLISQPKNLFLKSLTHNIVQRFSTPSTIHWTNYTSFLCIVFAILSHTFLCRIWMGTHFWVEPI